MRVFVFTFHYHKAMIENKDEDFINLIFFKIVDALNIDKARDDFDLRRFIKFREKKTLFALSALFFFNVSNLDIVFL